MVAGLVLNTSLRDLFRSIRTKNGKGTSKLDFYCKKATSGSKKAEYRLEKPAVIWHI
jgi:hypothetical protein